MGDLKQKMYPQLDMERTKSYLGPKTWNLLPDYTKEIQHMDTFEKEIKSWVPQNCPCKLC